MISLNNSNSISFNMKTVDKNNNAVTTGTTATANSTKIIHLELELPKLKYASITKVKLRFRQYSSSTADAYFVAASSNYMYTIDGKLMPCITENNIKYREVDVTGAFISSYAKKYFAIVSKTNELKLYTESSSYKPELIIDYIEDGESTINQKYVEGSAGRAINYSVNVRSGRPVFTKSLIKCDTTVMPLDLGIYFDPLNKNYSSLSMPNGWDFTYNQRVYKEGLEYKYIDGSGLLHTFLLAYNSTNIYFDSSGSGLIMKENTDDITITDGYNNNLYFMKNIGYLYKIERVIGDKKFDILVFRDFTNYNLLYLIINDGVTSTDECKVSFVYNSDNTISITSPGYPSITLTKDSNGRLASILEEDNRVSTFTYSNGMLETVASDNGEVSSFTYDERDRVASVTDYVSSTSNVINKLIFDYGYLNTYITNYFGVKKGYTFDEEGLLIGEYEETENQYSKVNYLEKTDNSYRSDKNSGEQYMVYNDIVVYGSEGSKNSVFARGDLNLNFTDTYKLNFIYNVDKDYVDVSKKSYIRVRQGREELVSKELDLRRTSDTLCALFFKLVENEPITVTVEHNNESQSAVSLKNVFITKANLKECYLCTNKVFDDATRFGTGTNSFYPLSKVEYKYNSSTLGNGEMYYEDLIENLKNMTLNSSNYNIWYNKKKGLIVNVNNVSVKQNDNFISLSNLVCGTATVDNKKIEFNYVDYTNDNTITNQLCKNITALYVEGSGQFTLNTDYINKYFQTIRRRDSKYFFWSIVTDYSYDAYGNILSEITSNTADSKKYVEEYTYDKMILKTKTTYVNGVASTTTFTTNVNTGLVEQVTYPDGSVQNVTYCPNTIGKFQKLSQTVDSVLNSNELTYNKDKVTNYKGTNTGFSLEYDGYNQVSKIKNASSVIWGIDRTITPTQIIENVWRSNTSSSLKSYYDTYGNLILVQDTSNGASYSDKLRYFYSDLETDSITASSPSDSSLCKSVNSKLKKVEDFKKTNTKKLYYNQLGKISKETNTDSTNKPSKVEYTYDNIERLSSKKYNDGTRIEGVEYSFIFGEDVYKYTSSLKQSVNGVTKTINSNVVYEKDYLDRIVKETITTVDSKKLIRKFTYVDDNDKATNLIKTVELSKDSTLLDTLTYSYDQMGRIIRAKNTSGSINTSYNYDLLGRLIRENNYELQKTFLYQYDKNGNIISKKIGPYTEGTLSNYSNVQSTYSATYSDELTNFNGQSVSISVPGNITKIGTTSYTWDKHRYLSKVYKASNDYTDYYYDGFGLRYRKAVYNNGTTITHEYVYDGSKILSENITGGLLSGKLEYIYLGNEVAGFTYNNKQYFFQKNLQGDIINIYDETNALVASYNYDAWGNCTITKNVNSIGTLNPFRYRGYYYDSETNLYYCNARYYNPEILRWMSLDSIEYIDPESINGCNLYAYCMNDPVNMNDPTGHFAILASILIGTAVGMLSSMVGQLAIEKKSFEELDWLDIVASGVAGAISGAIPISGIGSLVVNSAASALGKNAYVSFVSGESMDWEQTAIDFGINFVANGIGKVVSKGIDKVAANGLNKVSSYAKFKGTYGKNLTKEAAYKVMHNTSKIIANTKEVAIIVNDYATNYFGVFADSFIKKIFENKN